MRSVRFLSCWISSLPASMDPRPRASSSDTSVELTASKNMLARSGSSAPLQSERGGGCDEDAAGGRGSDDGAGFALSGGDSPLIEYVELNGGGGRDDKRRGAGWASSSDSML